MNILVAKNGSQLGPFSESDLRAKLASGEFSPTDFGWHEGLTAWSPLGQLVGDAAPPSAVPHPSPDLAPQPHYSPQPQAASPQPYSAPQTYNSPYPAPYQPGAPTPWGAPGAQGYGGFWRRFVAIIIDIILVIIVGFIVGLVIGIVLGVARVNRQTIGYIGNVFGFLLQWLYFSLFESSASQATPGKQAMGMKVTDLNGARIGFGQATGRYFGKIVSGITLGIGFIMAGFTERKQALHDMIASTLVVLK